MNKHKCTHTGYGRELWALLSMHKVQWLLSGTERKRLKHKTGTDPPPPKKRDCLWKDRILLFFILLCSDLIREKLSRARRHGLCVPFLTLENSYFALCWYWHPCKNVVVRCPGGCQWRRRYGGWGGGSWQDIWLSVWSTCWDQDPNELGGISPDKLCLFHIHCLHWFFNVLCAFFHTVKKSLKTNKKSIKQKNYLEGKKQKTKNALKKQPSHTHHNTDRTVSLLLAFSWEKLKKKKK